MGSEHFRFAQWAERRETAKKRHLSGGALGPTARAESDAAASQSSSSPAKHFTGLSTLGGFSVSEPIPCGVSAGRKLRNELGV